MFYQEISKDGENFIKFAHSDEPAGPRLDARNFRDRNALRLLAAGRAAGTRLRRHIGQREDDVSLGDNRRVVNGTSIILQVWPHAVEQPAVLGGPKFLTRAADPHRLKVAEREQGQPVRSNVAE